MSLIRLEQVAERRSIVRPEHKHTFTFLFFSYTSFPSLYFHSVSLQLYFSHHYYSALNKTISRQSNRYFVLFQGCMPWKSVAIFPLVKGTKVTASKPLCIVFENIQLRNKTSFFGGELLYVLIKESISGITPCRLEWQHGFTSIRRDFNGDKKTRNQFSFLVRSKYSYEYTKHIG